MFSSDKNKKQIINLRKRINKQLLKFHKHWQNAKRTEIYKNILLMKNKTSLLIHFFLKQIHSIVQSSEKTPDKYRFTNLTPVDSANLSAYDEAIQYVLKTKDLKNIAVTGPYGSGKTSVIRTYESKHKLNFLNISLAAFNEIETDKDPDDSLIEKSILQQLVYSQSANTLKYSRFKRITKPLHPHTTPIFLILWCVFGYIIYKSNNFILKIPPSDWPIPTNFADILKLISNQEFIVLSLSSLMFTIITYFLVHAIYQNIHRIKLKKISLNELEVDSVELENESILNKHIDEIIYFFEETDFDVVVFEDLDRFESRYIFTKLREINKLINDYFSKNNKRKSIKFIYGIKDLMFTNNNRVKFFDFIIPVVPIINSYSSYDVISKKADEIEKLFNLTKNKFDQDFLTDISLYLYDLRLINNIFNELQVYYEILPKRSTDINKLLAVIIYKNIYSSDFELQYLGKGFFVDLLEKKAELIENKVADVENKISQLKQSINRSKKEVVESEKQLISSYIGQIYTNVLQGREDSIFVNNQYILVRDLQDTTNFNNLANYSGEILAAIYNSAKRSTNVTFNQLSDAIHPGKTFSEIKQNIENKTIEQQAKYKTEITSLNEQKLYSRNIPLSAILKENIDVLKDTLTSDDNSKLFVYLITSGYLDENYQVYISNFHEGKLTIADYEYLQSIRSLQNITPEQILDNPKEVCDRMRTEEFNSPAVYNINLIDFLVEKTRKKDDDNRVSALNYISRHISDSETFISKYLDFGKNVKNFTIQLSILWPEMAIELFPFPFGSDVISLVLNNIEADYVANNMNTNNKLKLVIEEHANSIFASELQIPKDLTVLKQLDIKFNSIENFSNFPELINYIYQNNLYKINVENILFIMMHFYQIKNKKIITTSNYSRISSLPNEPLAKYIQDNIEDYIKSVFMLLKDNSGEDEESIIELMNNKIIPLGIRENILISRKSIVSDIESIPTELWTLALVEEKVKVTWENIEQYLNFEEMEEGVLDNVLNNFYNEITAEKYTKFENPPENWEYIHRFIFNNDRLDNNAYINLLNAMINIWETFPSVSKEKQILLINHHKVVLSEKSFPLDDDALTALLIEQNIDEYLNNETKYPLNTNHKHQLLVGGLGNLNKSEIAKSISLTEINALPSLATEAGKVLSESEVDISSVSFDVIKEIIKESNGEHSVKILNKLLPILNDQQVVSILKEIPDQKYSNLRVLKQQPKFPNREPFISFLNHLKNRNMISIRESKNRNTLTAYPKNVN